MSNQNTANRIETSLVLNITVEQEVEKPYFYCACCGHRHRGSAAVISVLNGNGEKLFTDASIKICSGCLAADGEAKIKLIVESLRNTLGEIPEYLKREQLGMVRSSMDLAIAQLCQDYRRHS